MFQPSQKITDMEDNKEEVTTNETENAPASPQELAELIQEFEQYRQRLIDDTTAAAQKAKLSQSKLKKQLEPELAKIDATLEKLRAQHAALTNSN